MFKNGTGATSTMEKSIWTNKANEMPFRCEIALMRLSTAFAQQGDTLKAIEVLRLVS